ncbi:hypothetical protein TWF694_010397 [Orbilia ellipsospora]|uniref:Uncharacterized protein n=1 Tax=Orbilia ellipsospora TaxID=2528407 RepID=A0AAV9X9S8_9PEZI
MPSGSGIVRSGPGDIFTAMFVIDDVQYSFTGKTSTEGEEFGCWKASLEFEDIQALQGDGTFEAEVGEQELSIVFANGPKITGTLQDPIIPKAIVKGQGHWITN